MHTTIHSLLPLLLLTAVVGATASSGAWAADAAPATAAARAAAQPASAGASNPARVDKRTPRAATAAETSQNALQPGELRPENPVVPQLSLPIGGQRDGAVAAVGTAASGAVVGTPGGIDDDAARCVAQGTRQDRAECRTQLQRPAPVAAATNKAPARTAGPNNAPAKR